MSKLQAWDAVIVLWEDAFSQYGPCNAKNYVKEYEPVMRKSIGFLIAKNDRHVHITATDDRMSHLLDNADDMTTIPMKMVHSITLLVPQETPVPVPQSKPL
jgi:hypothetical protein